MLIQNPNTQRRIDQSRSSTMRVTFYVLCFMQKSKILSYEIPALPLEFHEARGIKSKLFRHGTQSGVTNSLRRLRKIYRCRLLITGRPVKKEGCSSRGR